MAKRVLVTGGTGFVGANLARRLLREGHEVHLIVRPESRLWRIDEVQRELRLHQGNLQDPAQLDRVLGEIRPQWIFHLSAYGAYWWESDLDEMIRTNYLGTVNLVRAALKPGFEAFLNTGSSSEYGYKDFAPHEQEWLEPNSHYAVTKASASLFCRYTAQSLKTPIMTLRLYSVYGPFEDPNRLIPTLIVHGLAGRLPPLVHPDTARDFVFVDDVTTAYLQAAQSPPSEWGAVLNVASGKQTTLRQAVETAQLVMEITEKPNWASVPNRQWDTRTWVANIQRIKKDLGWEPSFSFESGLKRTVEWFKSTPLLDFYRSRIPVA